MRQAEAVAKRLQATEAPSHAMLKTDGQTASTEG
jgi:hypothetical protein